MKRLAAICMLMGAVLWALALSRPDQPRPMFADSLRWFTSPDLPGVQGAWVTGGERKAGPYLFRVRLDAGAQMPPHTHPDERHATILSGTLYVGFGERFDEAKLVAMPAGTVYLAPANKAHHLWAKDGPAEFQESGVGPTATVRITR